MGRGSAGEGGRICAHTSREAQGRGVAVQLCCESGNSCAARDADSQLDRDASWVPAIASRAPAQCHSGTLPTMTGIARGCLATIQTTPLVFLLPRDDGAALSRLTPRLSGSFSLSALICILPALERTVYNARLNSSLLPFDH